jgi:hypothetical protein
MSDPMIFAIMVLMVIVWHCLGLYWGYTYAIHHHKIKPLRGIYEYIQENFKTEWDAYALGVDEGYKAGLADRKANDESSHNPE